MAVQGISPLSGLQLVAPLGGMQADQSSVTHLWRKVGRLSGCTAGFFVLLCCHQALCQLLLKRRMCWRQRDGGAEAIGGVRKPAGFSVCSSCICQ